MEQLKERSDKCNEEPEVLSESINIKYVEYTYILINKIYVTWVC